MNNPTNNQHESLNPKNQWIIDLLQTQLERQVGPQRNAYIRAIRSLERCPCEIVNEHRAMEVDGIGPAFARMITKKLKQKYKYVNEDPAQAKSIVRKQYNQHQMREKETPKPCATKKRKTPRKKPKKAYKPRVGTGGYALLIYMYKAYQQHHITQFTKAQLMTGAQPYSDTSFTDPRGGDYTAWSAMSTLIKYEYVKAIRCGTNESIYCLQEEGKQIAIILYCELLDEPPPAQPDLSTFNSFALNHTEPDEVMAKHNFICPHCDRKYVRENPYKDHLSTKHPNGQNAKVRPTLLAPYQPPKAQKRRREDDTTRPAKRQKTDANDARKRIVIGSECYELYLVYDTSEERRKGSNERVRLEKQWSDYSIHCKAEKLSIGDFCWTLKSVSDPNKEYLYPIVVERKRMDDLAQSIVDKRYYEQKWRIKRSVPHFHHIYLVEGYAIEDESKKKRIHQSIVNTEVADSFLVYSTKSSLETNRIIAGWTQMIYQKIVKKVQANDDWIESEQMLLFEKFNRSLDNKKSCDMSAQMLFGRQLMAVDGVTDVIAYGITRKYETMRQLYDAWDGCDTIQKAKSLLYDEIDGSYLDYHRDLDSGLVKMDQDLWNVYRAMDQAKVKFISQRLSDKIWKSYCN